MNRLLILIGLMLYLPFSYASSQPPKILGNFSNQNFTPRGGVVPDTGPTELSPGFTLIQGVAPQRSDFEQLAADEPLITVGGHVKIMSNQLLYYCLSEGQIFMNVHIAMTAWRDTLRLQFLKLYLMC